MSDIIDFRAKKAERERPDDDCVMRDEFGREMFLFILDYEYQGAHWGAEIWSYSIEDAFARVEAMRKSLKCVGMKMGVVPA